MQTYHRKGFLLGLMVVGMLAGALSVAGSTYAASGNGPYYARPSWDQKLPCTAPSTCPRFVVLTDWNSEAVLDRNTGLVWEKTPKAELQTWSEARLSCLTRRTGGEMGWRLPAIAELASLVDPSVPFPGPTLPAGHPFTSVLSPTNVLPSNYWSATTNAENPTLAWFVHFGFGDVLTHNKAFSKQFWCVRGGMNADQY